MNIKLPPLPVRIIVAVIVIGALAYFGYQYLNPASASTLTASGSIEATIVNISPEIAGKVADVLVQESQPVKMNDPLLHLDPGLLNAQRAVAAAALQTANSTAQTAQGSYAVAQAQYNLTLASARANAAKIRTMDWMTKTQNYFDQPNWYFTQTEQITAAEVGIQSAANDLNNAQSNLDKAVADVNNAGFIDAETRLANARVAYLTALNTYSRAQSSNSNVSPDSLPIKIPPMAPNGYRIRVDIVNNMPDNQAIYDAAHDAYDAAKAELDSAQQTYDDLLNTDAANNILKSRAVLSVALERFQAAQDQLSKLQTGDQSLQVTAASAALDQAKSAIQQTLDAAKQAEANLALLDIQIAKLTIVAPMDGVILTRNVEPGEFVQPGAVTLTMADLTNLTITVYVPESLYGKISLGQSANVTVDSFPGETFTANVVHISDQAEFTPRNVQTVEGRSSTFYAIKLKVADPQGKLKIGMPADVVFK